MMVSHPLPIPLPFTSELYGVRLFNGCWLFAKQTFQPSYWMMLKREGFSGDLVGNSSELSLVLGMLGAEHLRAIYTLYHGSPPTHFFDFSLRGDIEHLILSGRIKAFYLSEDKTERLGNPQDVLYANPDSIDLNCESPVVAQRYRLAEELATDIMARWTQKDAEDLAHWDRFVLWRKGYEAYDITAEAFDTVYDFIVGLKDIAVFVVEISYEAAKTQLKVNRALLEMTYKGATGDIDGLRADLAKVGVMVDEKIDSAQKLIAQAEQGKKIFDALVNDPLTRNLIFDFLDSLYQSISYRESRTFKARIVFEIGIEVLLALATAGLGNVARRTAQTARATTNAIKATKTAQRIGPFTKHALDLMADLAKVMNKPIHVEEIPPVKGLELPDFGKLSKSELGGVGDSKASVNAPENRPSTSTKQKEKGLPNTVESNYVYFNETHKDSLPKPKGRGPNDGRLQSHHGLQQQWAKENLAEYGYDANMAPSITIETGKGLPHTTISKAQNARRDARISAGEGKWNSSLQEELQYIIDDMSSAGFQKQTIDQVLEQQYRMLDKLEVPYQRINIK
ncbi:hypothetical protein KO528_06910 [Saccharophagus degradans]|uniref:hypothetical protein n=1 Tax=Saccharophagus degradans TaxID=86304 RepID=UPI001C0870C8|nr:hypothetical protein [Saccharophagus degradans]MBU2985073.1 hypothetical protein [Saccharophagus degradans]